MNLADYPHRRYNPLTGEWVLCSPHRTKRPWLGQVEKPQPERLPAYDPGCYLCPGNARASGERNPQYTGTYVFENDFAALLPGTAAGDEMNEGGLFVAHSVAGVCRVICFSPRHDLTLARMTPAAIRGVVDAWAAETAALGAREEVGYVQVFENKGAMMGCSNPHPHCQVWASRHVPMIPAKKLAAQKAYLAAHGTDLLGDYLALERQKGERLVCQNRYWTALVPFWAVWPYETMLVPARRAPDLPSLTEAERDGLAEIIKDLATRYDNLFSTSFPYSMGWHGRPTDGEEHPYWRLHAVYYPPLLRSATVRKFLVGYEMTAEPQRDITPEWAAARLREAGGRHYLEEA
ncbi:MAG: UDP-glucose--hexose-1-phosphate uridylyltransferase [Bacteroidota bacterium]